MTAYFSPKTFTFLRGLARHNEREWFHAHKPEYEAHVRQPYQRLLIDLQPALAGISLHFRADPKTVGGSLYRIHRDTRYSHDKSPYKTWQGAKLYHERSRQVEAPSFRIHIQPGRSFVGAGLWHPETAIQRKIRKFIFDNPSGWNRAAHAPEFSKRYSRQSSDMLVRVPSGFPKDFAHADDLRHRIFAVTRVLDDCEITGDNLLNILKQDLASVAPFMDYLCASLDLEF